MWRWRVWVGLAVASACSSPRTDTTSSNTVEPADDGVDAELVSSMPTIDFGIVGGNKSFERSFDVTNIGSGPSAPLEIRLENTDTFPELSFTTSSCSNQLDPGQSCTFTIHLRTGTIGTRSGRLVVTAGVREATTEITAVVGVESLTALPFHDFGAVLLGTTTAERIYTITNAGTVPTSALVANVNFQSQDEYDFTSNTCTTLAPGDSCTVGVVFHPVVDHTRFGVLGLAAEIGGRASLGAVGTGTNDLLGVSPSPLSYSSIQFGQRSAPIIARVVNLAATSSDPIAVSIDGTGAAAFGIVSDSCTGVALAPGATCNVAVDCGPTVTNHEATLHLTATSGNGAVPLTCSGLQ